MTLIEISKNMPKTQSDIGFMAVEELSCFHLMNFFHVHQLSYMSNIISFSSVLPKNRSKASLFMMHSDILCNVPLNMLALKLTLKAAKKLANLQDMYMPSKILLKNAQILLEGHKCEIHKNILSVFKPFKC
jgi:hypothetical protein